MRSSVYLLWIFRTSMILLCWKFQKLTRLSFRVLQTSQQRLFFLRMVQFCWFLIFSSCSILFSLISCLALSLLSSISSLLFSLFLKLYCLNLSPLFLYYSILYIYFTLNDYNSACTFSLPAFIYCLSLYFCSSQWSIQLPLCAFTACTLNCFLRFYRRASACLSWRSASAQLKRDGYELQVSAMVFVLSIFINFIWFRYKLTIFCNIYTVLMSSSCLTPHSPQLIQHSKSQRIMAQPCPTLHLGQKHSLGPNQQENQLSLCMFYSL